MVSQLKKQMYSLKQVIARFEGSSGNITQSITFQGFTLFNLIVTTPLSVAIPHIGPHSQPKPTIPKPKQQRGDKKPPTKKLKTSLAIRIVDLTSEATQSVSALVVIEENTPSTSTVSPGSWDPSPHTASTSVKEMEFDLVECYIESLQGNGNQTSLLVSLLLGSSPIPGEESISSTLQSTGTTHFSDKFPCSPIIAINNPPPFFKCSPQHFKNGDPSQK